MTLDYKKLWILLIEKHITKAQFRKMVGISTATMTKLNKNELVSMEIIIRICHILNCDISDVVEICKYEGD